MATRRPLWGEKPSLAGPGLLCSGFPVLFRVWASLPLQPSWQAPGILGPTVPMSGMSSQQRLAYCHHCTLSLWKPSRMTDSNSFSLGTKALCQGHPAHPDTAAGRGHPQRQFLGVVGCSVHPPPPHAGPGGQQGGSSKTALKCSEDMAPKSSLQPVGCRYSPSRPLAPWTLG